MTEPALPDGIYLETCRDDDDEGTFVFARSRHATDATGDPLVIGHLHVPDENTGSATWQAGDVHIDTSWRRRGIASAMYDRMEAELDLDAFPATYQSPEAKAFWAARRARETA